MKQKPKAKGAAVPTKLNDHDADNKPGYKGKGDGDKDDKYIKGIKQAKKGKK